MIWVEVPGRPSSPAPSADAAVVAAALTELQGETVTVEDVQGTTEGEFIDECVAGYSEIEGEKIAFDIVTKDYTYLNWIIWFFSRFYCL